MLVGIETCDDGKVDLQGCKDTCVGVRKGWRCFGGKVDKASLCLPICGDSLAVPEDECDDGNPFD